MRFTVFTPAYNRAHTLERLYMSLTKQTFRDFEWLVIDDGSTDNTEELMKHILAEENFFSIRYVRVENGGKHRAINKGVSMSEADLFYIVDSDDYLPESSLEIIDGVEKTITDSQKVYFGGVCGIKSYPNGNNVGNTFNGEILDITMLERVQHGIEGDRAEVFYTQVLRKYPFPEFDGENFMTECIVWDRIARDGYKLRFFNQGVYYCEYLADGLSANSDKLFERNPKGYALFISQSVALGKIRGMQKWQLYLRFYTQNKRRMKFRSIAKSLKINPIRLFFRITGMRVFYKLYSR